MTILNNLPTTHLDARISDHRTVEIGSALFAEMGRSPSPFDRAWWDDRLMGLSMEDSEVKVQLFRFIDVLPALETPESISTHLADYLHQAGNRVPGWLRSVLRFGRPGTFRGEILARLAKAGAGHMARRFIAGSTPTEAFRTVLGLRRRHLGFTADLLGEAVISEAEADHYQGTCIDLLRGLSSPLAIEPEDRQIDRDDRGPIPRVNLSLKLTSLTTHFDAIHAEATTRVVLSRLRPILRVARAVGAFVNVDMEQHAHKDLTYAIFKTVISEPEFRDWADVGIVAQAYLPEAESDLDRLADWVDERGTPITVRLVKGAYWDYEVTHARQVGWPVPVYLRKWETDANYERCSRFLLQSHERLRPAFASHNVRSLAHALSTAETLGVDPSAFEVQMLHGMGDSIARALARRGLRVRVYTPYGALLPGMAYLVRRLLENTSNESFLKASSSDRAVVKDLLRDPEETGAMWRRRQPSPPDRGSAEPQAFENTPLCDFSRLENQDRMRRALNDVKEQLGRTYPIRIGVKPALPRADEIRDASTDPGEHSRVLGWTVRGRIEDAAEAVRVAKAAQVVWGSTPPVDRAAVLFRAASILRERRFELAAWEVYECAKPWREADADVAEAIDFCNFYAQQMVRLSRPDHRDVPGETNAIERIARGVVVVIPPWNFPLAIPTGMTVAALVAGNSVILKPAEQSPVIAAHLVSILQEAGLPTGVVAYLPGRGEEVGQALVDDPRVDLIAFTGSRGVGLEINRRAAESRPDQSHVKRVIAEMGGKNAIIVDEDADLDEAVVGVIQSAFGYAGQKCSACSRVIVLDGVHDAFVNRLADAARALVVGPADNPETMVPPLIDPQARDRVLSYARTATEQGAVGLVEMGVGSLAIQGNYVGPHIYKGVKPDDRIAREEIFGPILAILRARDLGEALAILHATEYALTGGLYSRSPASIERFKRECRVGNLYINRAITGALVDRQPFGGFKLSGIGTKAGGVNYLNEFLLTRTVTENTLRRGFAPEEETSRLGESV